MEFWTEKLLSPLKYDGGLMFKLNFAYFIYIKKQWESKACGIFYSEIQLSKNMYQYNSQFKQEPEVIIQTPHDMPGRLTHLS